MTAVPQAAASYPTPTASPAPVAGSAATTPSSPSPEMGAECACHAISGAWSRPRRILPFMSSRACHCASGCWRRRSPRACHRCVPAFVVSYGRFQPIIMSATGRERLYDSLGCGRWSASSCWLASPILERLQWRFHPRACDRALWPLHLETGHSQRQIPRASTAAGGRTRPLMTRD